MSPIAESLPARCWSAGAVLAARPRRSRADPRAGAVPEVGDHRDGDRQENPLLDPDDDRGGCYQRDPELGPASLEDTPRAGSVDELDTDQKDDPRQHSVVYVGTRLGQDGRATSARVARPSCPFSDTRPKSRADRSLAGEHCLGLALQVEIGFAADVHGHSLERAAGEAVRRLTRIVVGDGFAAVAANA